MVEKITVRKTASVWLPWEVLTPGAEKPALFMFGREANRHAAYLASLVKRNARIWAERNK